VKSSSLKHLCLHRWMELRGTVLHASSEGPGWKWAQLQSLMLKPSQKMLYFVTTRAHILRDEVLTTAATRQRNISPDSEWWAAPHPHGKMYRRTHTHETFMITRGSFFPRDMSIPGRVHVLYVCPLIGEKTRWWLRVRPTNPLLSDSLERVSVCG
jgi:hypothetical protein